jgi:hypothetical protein
MIGVTIHMTYLQSNIRLTNFGGGIMVSNRSNQKLGGLFAIISALLGIGSMALYSAVGMRGVTGENIYEKTVNAMAAHPFVIWASMLIGVLVAVLLFWTFEALDQRLRSIFPNMSSTGVKFAYFHLFTYAIYMILPGAGLHDIVNGDAVLSESLHYMVPFIELSSVVYVISSIFLSLYLFQVGARIFKSNNLSKALGGYTFLIGITVLAAGTLELLLGRGTSAVIILSMVTFLCAFVVWKIWLGVEMIRKPLPQADVNEEKKIAV